MAAAPPIAGVRKPSNRDWLDCDRTFAEEADKVILLLCQGSDDAGEHAMQLICNYKESPLAYTILAEVKLARMNQQMAKGHLNSAKVLAPRCPHIAFVLALVLMRLGFWDEAVVECDRSLGEPEPTDPAWHCPFPKIHIDAIIRSKAPKHRIALMRERIRRLRFRAKKGNRTAVPQKPLSSAPKWPPESVDVDRARYDWGRMSEEERQAFMTVSFEDMKSYCRSGGLSKQMTGVLSDAEEFVKGFFEWKDNESAESWQESIQRYNQANLRPEVLFFEHATAGTLHRKV
ncbi:hypothetical protein E2562_017372 [Oryza meyeriana var. granulata]|uniref:Uncharacterized protein n=1 Tax=Oryza meyeriana var. granulata TaxID=110450 RepID=A0A6G1D4V0_9ORYZ|nr:hypothetical protein E2562_017372 [Oryza meyeriana var. granulata]